MFDDILNDTEITDDLFNYIQNNLTKGYRSIVGQPINIKTKLHDKSIIYDANMPWNYSGYKCELILHVEIRSTLSDALYIHTNAASIFHYGNRLHRNNIHSQIYENCNIISKFTDIVYKFVTLEEFETDMYMIRELNRIKQLR